MGHMPQSQMASQISLTCRPCRLCMLDLYGSSRRTRLTMMTSSLPPIQIQNRPIRLHVKHAPVVEPTLWTEPRLGLCRSRRHEEEAGDANDEGEDALEQKQVSPACRPSGVISVVFHIINVGVQTHQRSRQGRASVEYRSP